MKVNRHLAQLVIRDLQQFSGLAFTQPDRLTRSEAEQVRSWAMAQPAVMKALRHRGDDEHTSVRLFQGVVDYFAEQHPQEASGGPAAWTEGRLLDDHTPIAEMTAEEATARLAWAETQAEYRTAYTDKAASNHDLLVQHTFALRERAAGVTAPGAPANENLMPLSPEVIEQIELAGNDPAYASPTHPEHRAAVQNMEAAFAAAYPAQGGPGAPNGSSPEAQLRVQTRAIQEHPAYLNRLHPEHGAKVAEMTAIFQAAYPEPSEGK